MLDCYNKARATNPTLRGKLKLKITISDMGFATNVEADPAEPSYDPAMVVCLGDAFKTAAFPKPGGQMTATVLVPLVFRP